MKKFVQLIVGVVIGCTVVYAVAMFVPEQNPQTHKNEVIHTVRTTARPDCAYLEVVVAGSFDRYAPCAYLNGREQLVEPFLVGSAYVDIDQARRIRESLRE